MNHSRRPLLLFLFTFLCVMLWQAWTNHKEAASVLTAPITTPRVKQPAQGLAKAGEVIITTDVMVMKLSKLGATVTGVGLLKFPQSLTDHAPFSLFNKTKEHVYTAQSGFVDATLTFQLEEGSQVAMKEGEDTLAVTMKAKDTRGGVHKKTFLFKRGEYAVRVQSSLQNTGTQPFSTQHVSRFDLTQDFLPGDTRAELVVDPNQTKPGWFTFSTFTGPSYYTEATPYSKYPLKDAESKGLNTKVSGENWIAMQQRYFISAWVNQDKKAEHWVSTQMQVDNSTQTKRKQFTFKNMATPVELAPGQMVQEQGLLYAGPEEVGRLQHLAPGLKLTIDYGWLWFLSSILFDIMVFVQKYLHNWGATIIMTTILIKLLFYKMSESSYKMMAQQKKLKPKIDAINEKYKDMPEKKNQALLDLYQKESINPLRSGCLPSLLPLPFFIALNYVFIESVQLRHASFAWIPDLSAQDPLYILPALMGLSMFVQQRLSPPQDDPAQEKAMMIVPLMMCVMFAQFPAGLVLYTLTNQILSNIQQYYVMRTVGTFKWS